MQSEASIRAAAAELDEALESHWAEILTYSDDLVTRLRLYFNPLDFAPAVGRLGRMIGPAANRLARRGLAPVDD